MSSPIATNTNAEAFRAYAAPEEAIPRCLCCDYILIGLPGDHCPECGARIDWEVVHRAAARRPTIAFERARGWNKPAAFLLTALTILFAPWVFARQVTRRASVGHALAFSALCTLGPVAGFVIGSLTGSVPGGLDSVLMKTWLSTAAIYVVVQALVLALLDFSGWRRPLHSLVRWLAVSCYSAAIMLTEWYWGPPPITLTDCPPSALALLEADWSQLEGLWTDAGPVGTVVLAAQMIIWLTGLALCYHARVARTRVPRIAALATSAAAWISALLLYAAAFQFVGYPLYVYFHPFL